MAAVISHSGSRTVSTTVFVIAIDTYSLDVSGEQEVGLAQAIESRTHDLPFRPALPRRHRHLPARG